MIKLYKLIDKLLNNFIPLGHIRKSNFLFSRFLHKGSVSKIGVIA